MLTKYSSFKSNNFEYYCKKVTLKTQLGRKTSNVSALSDFKFEKETSEAKRFPCAVKSQYWTQRSRM